MEKRAIYIPDIRFEKMNVFKLNEKLQVFEMINDKEIIYEKEVVLNDDNFLLFTIDQDKRVSLVENRDKINLLDCCYMNIKIKKLTNELLPLDLLLKADPNEKLVKEYVEEGEVYLSFLDDEYFNDELVGVAVTLKVNKNDLEIKNISIKDEFQNKKYAKKMIEFLTKLAKEEGYDNLIIATGNSSINQLALYQKCGFSIDYIKKDFFTLNYDEEIIENNIICKDMIVLKKKLNDKRDIKTPHIYRHFKGKEYVTMAISYPNKDIEKRNQDKLKATHTETNIMIDIYKYKDLYFHDENIDSNPLIIYKTLYDDSGVFARPKEMFLSLVDKSKYPDIKIKYRFEEI